MKTIFSILLNSSQKKLPISHEPYGIMYASVAEKADTETGRNIMKANSLKIAFYSEKIAFIGGGGVI